VAGTTDWPVGQLLCIAHGVLIGAIALLSSTPGRYGPAELRLAEELASRSALSIENAPVRSGTSRDKGS
jgi:GAF domain-containing protein